VDRQQKTNLEGVFAAGDVTCGGLQIASATGEGCMAAIQAINHVRKKW
jgi:thioredoxin reductase (NADPH)